MIHAVMLLLVTCAGADEPVQFQRLPTEYETHVRPIIKKVCLECHSTEREEGELDLEQFGSFDAVRQRPQTWQKVAEMLDNGEMPPEDSNQPTEAERTQLRSWVQNYLNAEALAGAGDPGPVILRRLSNAEYNYTIRDLTGIDSLDPTREFPVDGAAGEGFTNAGSAQAMSPSLVQKYLDAAKVIADHAVLLPDGIAFSTYTTQRDQTDELIRRIQAFYRRFSTDGGGQAVNLQGIQFETNQGGLLPLEEYLAATLDERDALAAGEKTTAKVAAERSLNEKHLDELWRALSSSDDQGALMNLLRSRWRDAQAGHAGQLVAEIAPIQKALWQFNSIGHIGDDGQPKIWMEPVTPIAERREFSLKLPESAEDVSVFLIASDAGDGNQHDYVVWQNPRLVADNRPDLALRDVAGLQKRIQQRNRAVLSRTADYLTAVAEFTATDADERDAAELARKHKLGVDALNIWLDYLAISEPEPVTVRGHIQTKHVSGTYSFVNGWGVSETPIILGNASDQQVRIPGIARPRSIVAHPSPTLFIAAGWYSPIDGLVRVEAHLSDAHPECGNGQQYRVQHRTGRKAGNLWQGDFGTGGSAKMPPKTIAVRKGELISLIVGPRQGNHTCDLTEINLVIAEVEGQQRTWDLAKDCASDMQAGNPHADGYGNSTTWHFYQGPMDSWNDDAGSPVSVPAGSLLARWQQAADGDERNDLAQQVQALATGQSPPAENTPDAVLLAQLERLASSRMDLQKLLSDVEADDRFGKHPLGDAMPASDLIVQAPAVIEFRIPAEWAAGRTLVATGRLETEHGREGSIRLDVTTNRVEPSALSWSIPVVVNDGSRSQQRYESALARFRDLFPPALCYERIVPVDEVVTLTLYYRQDDALQRLMLNEAQVAELNRLWDELFYVAHEPLKFQVAYEQIREFATQDRPDMVKQLDPLKEAINTRADAFRQRLLDTEPAHLQALLEFADRAWRRRLDAEERAAILDFYQSLKLDEIPHDEAVRLTMARVLASPAFLYRREESPPGSEPAPVSDLELANRMSYFFWSSLPDDNLRQAADSGTLNSDETLRAQARRMLKDPRTRRLAIHFACQWLHVRDFDQTVEKNERLYPEFAELRDDMYEETVRFFEDMFRNDRSILSMLDADHTFVTEALAQHYGLSVDPAAPPISPNQLDDHASWRIDSVRQQGRGGVLGMATVLASQSGVSRSSPILRGNWIYETLLGERLPRPPADVPQLPEETPPDLTARQLIERHSSDPACAKCHAKIDPYGFALEQFDTVGRLRSGPVDTKTELVDGTDIEGLDGLRRYLMNDRRDDFVRQFCRKLLGYALGREVQLSDTPLIDRMMQDLAENEYRFSVAVETMVLSRQFRMVRGQLAADDR